MAWTFDTDAANNHDAGALIGVFDAEKGVVNYMWALSSQRCSDVLRLLVRYHTRREAFAQFVAYVRKHDYVRIAPRASMMEGSNKTQWSSIDHAGWNGATNCRDERPGFYSYAFLHKDGGWHFRDHEEKWQRGELLFGQGVS